MKEKNMTALVSCFARCYHYQNNKYRIFSDNIAQKILRKEEYDSIASNMSNGIKFFNPNFVDTKEEFQFAVEKMQKLVFRHHKGEL